ncbi:MAG: N-6 DNA methylase, partial [Alphaproteobacteria bacterium]|nr:N-6 DNA methylase [Alphaproteobacteria bacterium]
MVEKALNNYLATLQDTFSKAKDATELTYRLTLETLLKQVGKAHNITHEPKRHKDGLGAPDFMIKQSGMIVGYVEAKDVGVNLDHVLKSDQIKKYQQLTSNLLITNNLEWIWIHKGHIVRETLCYQTDLQSRKFKPNPDKIAAVGKLLEGFFSTPPKGINRAKELAQELSIRTRGLRDYLAAELQRQSKEDQQGRLHGLYQIFQKTISSQLTVEEFADAFAQTLSYGLFLAKLNAGSNITITLSNAKDYIANNFELIRELVSFLDELKNDSYLDTRWLVEEILGLLNGLDLLAIQEDLSFSKKQGRLFPPSEEERLLFAKDPYVYFYEDFLKAYDKETRKSRGIYYTPPPVVNFIIRAIQDILKKTFGIAAGLADHQKVTLLDFATGTGTFLIEVLQQIFEETPSAKHSLVIKDHILKNIYGFEYLIAPYTIAHLKLSQFLHDKGYGMQPKERLQIYLANTLESPDETLQKDWLVPALTKEAEQARDIKRKKKILVITGNPPYSGHSLNKGAWISNLLKGKDLNNPKEILADYFEVDGKHLGEKNPKWLQDDYVKFIRFAQWKMDQVDEGVVGIITNHSFLDNPTFRGMRQSLLKSFNQIYILDLHGNSKKKEKSPDGSKDENVFDIEQ